MEYLLKVSAIVAIFYVSYKLFLERDTFFEQNRWFLLLGLITSFVIPFFVIPVYIEYTPVSTNFIYRDMVMETAEEPFNILDYLPAIYALGALCFFVRFIIQLTSLGFVVFKNKSEKQGPFTFVTTNKNTSPFSFFNWIVYNPNNFTKTELEQIITHEKVHASQYHSVDNLLTQLTCIAIWFNPFIWLYNKDLKQNLEFIADQETQRKFNCKKSYQTILLKTSMPSHQMALSNHFYNSLIKKRIVMLHKSKSKKINLLKYVLVLPALAAFLMSFNTEEVYVEKRRTNTEEQTSDTQKPTESDTLKIIFDKNLSEKDFEQIKSKLELIKINFIYSELKRNDKDEIINITTKFESEGGHCTYHATDGPIKPFYFFKSGTTSGVGPVEKETQKNLPKHFKPFNVTITKNFTEKNFKNAIKKGKEKGVILEFSKIKRNTENEIIGIDVKFKTENSSGNYTLNGKKPIKPFAYRQNEESNGFYRDWETSLKIGKPFSDAKVIEDSNVIFKQGNKIIASNSIIFNKGIITADTLRVDPNYTNSIRKLKISNGKEKPLFIVDGKEMEKEEFNKISPDDIHSVAVLKGEAATSVYGKKGKNGVILITTKKGHSNNKSINNKNLDDVIAIATTPTNKISLNTKDGKEPLYIVDGKEITKKEFDKISSEKVKSIDILKDEQSTKKYGDKGKNGVVLITTKKGSSWNLSTGQNTLSYSNSLNKTQVIGYGDSISKIKTGVKVNPWKVSVGVNATKEGKYPLILLDSKEISNDELGKVNPNDIKSTDVIKDENTTKKYGEKAKNGVVVITTKTPLTISGTVKDSKGLGLPGVNIVIQNSGKKFVTDFDGNYKMKAYKGDIIIFSYKGLTSKKITIDDKTAIDITLKE